MSSLIRFGRILPLVLWIGGIAFFAFVVAPVAFGKLPSTHEAGLVVGATLRVLHLVGLVCGAIFLLLSLTGYRRNLSQRLLLTEVVLAVSMLLVTGYSQFHVLPAMERDRAAAGGEIGAAAASDPARAHFEGLHKLSERLEGFVLFGGLALLFAVSSEGGGVVRPLES